MSSLPDATDVIEEIKSKQTRRKIFISGGIVVGILMLCGVIGIMSGLLTLLVGAPTPTTIAAATDTPDLGTTTESPASTTVEPAAPSTIQPTTKPTAPPATEPTQEPAIEPPQQPTQEQTIEPTAPPTDEPAVPPTAELTAEPTAEPTQEPTSEPLTGKIAVPVFEKAPDNINDIYNLYLASADNGWKPKLLFERASQPAFLKNGQGMVLRSWEHKDWGQQLIYLPNYSDFTQFRKMTDFIEDAHPSLNDKNVIIFHSRQESLKRDPIIIKIGTEPGSAPIKLGEGTNPDWLGNRIIFYKSFPQAGLYVMGENGGEAQPVLPTGKTVPAAAPDGDRVAVPLQKDAHWQIFTFSASQGEGSLNQLTSTPDADNYLSTWSPDGQYIAFASNRDKQWAIWVMKADGSEQRKLFDLPGPVDGKITSPNIDPALSFGWWEERLSWAP